MGDSVKLKPNTHVFDIYHNELDAANNAEYGQLHTPLPLPLSITLPPFPEIVPGTEDYTLAKNEQLELATGAYHDIILQQGSTLTLTGGIYQFSNLNIGNNANLFVTAPTEIRLANRLESGQGAVIRPTRTSGLDASDLIFYIAGINGKNGDLNKTPRVATIGHNNELAASMYVPNGTLLLNQGTEARGAFIAKDVQVGKNVQVWLESAFGDNGSGTVTPTATNIPSATDTPISTATATFEPSETPTHTPTITVTSSPTETPTDVPTGIATATPTIPTGTPTNAPTETVTTTPTVTSTKLPVAANFSASPVSGEAPLIVSFVDMSIGNITSYDWDFGDGSQAGESHPTHIYTARGVYTVTLTVTDDTGMQDTLVRPSYIFIDPAPVVIPNQAPLITITNPVENQVLGSGSLEINGNISDDGSMISVLVNDIPATVNGNTFSANITLAGGNQTIQAVVEDDEGAMGFDSIVVSIDNEGPVIDIQKPADKQSVYTLNPAVVIQYTDFLDTVNTSSVLVQITDANNVTTDVTGDLALTADSASGILSSALTTETSYTMTVLAADGYGNTSNASVSFYVPADPDSIILPTETEDAGWVSGVVYDSSTCNEHLTTCQGLPGVRITFSKAGDTTDMITGTIVTGPDGFFAFPFTETAVYWLRAEKDGFTYGQREVAAVKERSTAVNEIYLTPIDTAHTPCTETGCFHTSSDGNMQVIIPSGAIGTDETVDVTATEFNRVYFLPSGQLPPGTWETYAFNLGGDSDYAFQRPITVTIRNSRGFDPGTKIPLGYWNQDTLQWEHEGVAEVDDTGQWVVMRVSHFSNHDPNFPTVRSGFDVTPSPKDGCDGYCSAGASGSFIDYKSGRLQEWIDLPETNVMGDSVALQLHYNTARAQPSFVIDVELDAEVQGNINTDQIQWQLYIEGERTDNFTFAADLSSSGEIGRFRFFWDGRNAQGEELPPGIYSYAMRIRIPYEAEYCGVVGNIFGNDPDCDNQPTGRYTTATEEQWVFGIVPLAGTPDPSLGDGWMLTGQQRLYADEAGNILVTDARNQAEYHSALADRLEGRGQYNNVQPQVLGPSAAVPVPELPTSGTFVSGVINANTTWTMAQSPYIITDTVIVADGVHLTIESGTQVMLDQYQSLVVEGNISAVGTLTQPITFTAYSEGTFSSWEKYSGYTFNMPVQSIAIDSNDSVWFAGFYDDGSGNTSGVVQHLNADLSTWDSFYMPDTIAASQVYEIAIDGLGQKWITTDGGVAMLATNGDWTVYQAGSSGLASNFVYAVAVDANDNIWFGTDSGVSKFAAGIWTTYTTAHGLAANTVRAIMPGKDGSMWFGTNSGLNQLDTNGNWTTYDTNNSNILSNDVEDIAIDDENNVWLTNPGAGISRLSSAQVWTTYTTSNSGLASASVWSIAVDREGRKWIGYMMNGVSILAADNSEWMHETPPRLGGDTVLDITSAFNGDVWLAHESDGATRSYGGSGVTTDNTIRSGYWDTIQIGGGSNLADSDSSQLSYVNIEAGGASDKGSLYIYQSAPTLTNLRVWGSGNHGIEVVDSSGFSLSDSTVTANRQDGIHLQSSLGGHTLNNISIQANNGHGVYLAHPGAVSITGATTADNRGHGIFTENAGNELDLDNSTIQNNKVAARLAVNTTLTNNEWLDNTSQQIEWLGGTLSNNKVWVNEVEAYVVLGTIHVPDNVALTIDPGLSLLFADSNAYLNVSGALFASGTLDMPIYFGPTANLGSRWSGIYLGGGITGDSDVSHLEYAIFQDAFTGLYINNSTPTLDHLSFLDNDVGLEVVNSSGLVVSNSNFTNNTSFGLENFTPSQPVTAVNNYWGAGGPNHSAYPENSGDKVNGVVILAPWRTTPVTMEGVGSQIVGQTGPDHTTLTYDTSSGTYTRYYPDGGQIHFDIQGRHDYTLYADGRRFTYTYNPDGTTAAMALTAPGETIAHWVWDFTYTNGQLDSIIDPARRTTSFGLNAQGQLNQVAYPDGSHEAFFYDSQGQMTQHTDKSGAVTNFNFDAYGRINSEAQPMRAVFEPATRQTSAASPVHAFTPSDTAYPLLNESAVGDPDFPADAVPKSAALVDGVAFGRGGLSGLTNRWGQWQEVTDATGRTTAYDRDNDNNLLKQTYNNGDCELFTYDAMGNPLTASRLSAADCAQPTPVNPQTVSLSYESRFNQIKTITDPDGNTTTYFYDYEVDANDGDLNDDAQLVRVAYTAVPDETGQLVIPTEYYSYNQWGLLETKTDADGKVTRYVYTQDSDTGLFLPGVTPKPGLLTQVISGDDTATPLTTTYQDFNAQGYALTLIAPGGQNITHYAYDEWGRVISQTNAAKATTLYTYNEQGNLAQRIEDYTADGVTGANIVTDYRYDDSQQLVAEERGAAGLAAHTRYGYDINGNPSQRLDELNLGSVTLYDDANRPTQSINAIGEVITTTYDLKGRVETTISPDGVVDRTEYDDFGWVARRISNWVDGVYDANMPDEDLITSYQYDDRNNTTIVTDTTGRMNRTFYDNLNRTVGSISNWQDTISLDDCYDGSLPLNRDYNICSRTAYDEVGRTHIVTDTLGRMNRTFYDELGRIEASVNNWNPATLTTPADCILSPTNENEENICTLYGYDSTGRQITTTNALNQTSLTVYDAADRQVVSVSNWDGVTAFTEAADCVAPPLVADVNVCSVSVYDTLGRQTRSIHALGHFTDYAYDGLGRVVTTTRYLANGTPVSSISHYDERGQQYAHTDAEGHTSKSVFDDLGRVTTSITPMGIASTQTYDDAGQVVASTNALGYTNSSLYDDLGRLRVSTNPLTHTTSYQYNSLGNQETVTDAEGVVTRYEYDGLNRQIAVIENWDGIASCQPGTSSSDTNVCTQYSYDASGNQIMTVNALGITAKLTTYDTLNRVIVEEDALGNQTHTQYNALGYRTVMTDANEAITRYTYDGLNRLKEVVYEADSETVTYAYDALGNRTAMTDSLGVTSYEYDTLSRLITVTSPLTGTVIYGYDLVGNQTNLTYPGGKVITTTYNGDGQKVAVTDWDGGMTRYTYDAAGRLTTTTLPNGVQTTNDYDPANRLTGISHVDLNSGTLQAAYLYELDKRGHNTVVTETMRLPDGSGLNHQVIVYDYDPLYRITEAAYTGVLSDTYAYEYNAVGSRVYFSTNITQTETTTYTYNIANQLQESKNLLTAELITYDWDDAGRLITTTVASVVDKVYQYSQDGDLTQAEVAGLVTTFAYDGNGSRLQMSIAGDTTTYLPDYGGRSSRVLFEQGTAETKQYLYGVACLGEFVTDNATNDTEWRYYQRDAKSLVRQTTNEAATITLAWTFSPEGGVLLGEEGPVTHLGCGDDAVHDWSTGLIFKGGRYFDPNNGIWITMSGAVIWQRRQTSSRRKRRMSKKMRYLITIFLLLVLVLALTGCGDPSPDVPDCPTPSQTPTPGAPTETPTLPPTDTATPPPPTNTPTLPPTITPTLPPTITPSPTPSPTPTPTPAPTLWASSPVRTNGKLPDWIQWYGYTEYAKTYSYGNKDKIHGGMDFGRRADLFEEYDPSKDGSGVKVYAATMTTVNVLEKTLYRGLGRIKISLSDGSTGFYDHLDPDYMLVEPGDSVSNDTPIGYLEETERHVHLERRPYNDGYITNPLPFFESTIRNSFVNWNSEIEDSVRTRYDDKYKWPLDPGAGVPRQNWKDPLIQPETSY